MDQMYYGQVNIWLELYGKGKGKYSSPIPFEDPIFQVSSFF